MSYPRLIVERMFVLGPHRRSTGMDSDAKLAEAILYLAYRLPPGSAAGATKINKLLFFAEFAHVRETGETITGAEYRRLPNGPAPRRLRPVRQRLVENSDAKIVKEPYLGRMQDRLLALRDAHPDAFTSSERAALDEVLHVYETYTGSELSDLSHIEPAWDFFDDGDTIPPAMAFLSDAPPSRRALQRARELAERFATR